MGTRGAITRVRNDSGFIGTYHHWDSYPSGLGQTLWSIFHKVFNQNLPRMLKVLIDDHPAGWSTINNKDFGLDPGFVESQKNSTQEQKTKPECYCHGDRESEPWAVTEENASGSGVEYAYVFDEEKGLMLIKSSYRENGEKMVGYFGAGDPDAEWKNIASVDLSGKEPDWEKLDKN